MVGLYTLLESLLNKSNKKKLLTDIMFRGAISKIKPDQECLEEDMMEVYDDTVHLRTAPNWSKDEYGEIFKRFGIRKIILDPMGNKYKIISLWSNVSDMEIYLNNGASVSCYSNREDITWTDVKVVADGKWNILSMSATNNITLKNCHIHTTSQPPALFFF